LASAELPRTQLIVAFAGVAVGMVILSLLPWSRQGRVPQAQQRPEQVAGYPVPPLPGVEEDQRA
jgi:hypothetical protein